MNILVTGGKNAKVLKLLKAFPEDFIVFADYGEVPEVATSTYRFASLGEKNEQSIAHVFLDFCLSESIEMIVPTHGFEIEQMAKASQLFAEYDIKILLPDVNELKLYLKKTYFLNPSFLIVNEGKVIFSSTENIITSLPANLSGVFELQSETGKLKLFLV